MNIKDGEKLRVGHNGHGMQSQRSYFFFLEEHAPKPYKWLYPPPFCRECCFVYKLIAHMHEKVHEGNMSWFTWKCLLHVCAITLCKFGDMYGIFVVNRIHNIAAAYS